MTGTDLPPPAPSQSAEPAGPTSGELFHQSARAETAWVWVALPVAGLLVVPLAGLVYAMTSSFGHDAAGLASGAPVTEGAEGELDGDLRTTTPAGARKSTAKTKRTTAKAKTSQKPRSDGAAVCCAKLEELGKSAPLDTRGTYLAAARVCEAADDAETAFKQARSAVGAARAEVPEECQ